MFTGIITDLGRVRSVEREGDTRFVIATGYETADLALGASVCCSGVCLTVIDKGASASGQGNWFAVSASAETLSRSTLGEWRAGTLVNLERALRLGDELGGHLVSGHVDGVGRIVAITDEGDSKRFVLAAPAALMRFIAEKGSVAVDGVSLTVNEVDDDRFGVNLIPHTLHATAFGRGATGQRVNLEIDMVARYVARLLARE